MKKLIFQVSVGKPSKLYTTCINSVAEYCKKYSIDHIVLTEPKLKIRPCVPGLDNKRAHFLLP